MAITILDNNDKKELETKITNNGNNITILKEDLGKLNKIEVAEFDGYIRNDGVVELQDSFIKEKYTGFIPILNNIKIVLKHVCESQVNMWVAICMYDSKKNFIKREVVFEKLSNKFSYTYIPIEEVSFIKMTYRSFNTKMQIEINECFQNINEHIQHINGQIQTINKKIQHVDFDFNGYLDSNGNVSPQQSDFYEKTSDFLFVQEGQKYTFISAIPTSKVGWQGICEYGSDKKFITRLTNNIAQFINVNNQDFYIFNIIVPKGCEYLRFSTRTFGSEYRVFDYTNSAIIKTINEFLLKNNGKFNVNNNILSINHRGYNLVAPENTLVAFKLSKKMGFDIVETDVAFTSDNVPVLLHDDTVDRTSNGTGAINTLTLTQVKALDFGSWKDAKYAGEKIPTFEEFILLCKKIGLQPYIEPKGALTDIQAKTLVDIVKKYGMLGRATWISMNKPTLNFIKKYDELDRLGFVCNVIDQDYVNFIESLKTTTNEVFIDAAHQNLTPETVQMCIERNIPLEVWTLNTEDELDKMNPYVSGVTTDLLSILDVWFSKQGIY